MADYCTVANVQAYLPLASVTLGVGSEPTSTVVGSWITSHTAWMDDCLAWRYVVPIVHATDLETLRLICAMLTAADLFQFLESSDARIPSGESVNRMSERLRAQALLTLVYQPGANKQFIPGLGTASVVGALDRSGRSFLVLRGTGFAQTATGLAARVSTTLTDPEGDDSNPRYFGIGRAL